MNSISTHFYQIGVVLPMILSDLSLPEQGKLREILADSESQVMRAQLITGFDNYHIPRSSRYIRARENSNSTGSAQPTALKNQLSPQLLSRLATLSAKVSKTS
jgi:hypothetical protein